MATRVSPQAECYGGPFDGRILYRPFRDLTVYQSGELLSIGIALKDSKALGEYIEDPSSDTWLLWKASKANG